MGIFSFVIICGILGFIIGVLIGMFVTNLWEFFH